MPPSAVSRRTCSRQHARDRPSPRLGHDGTETSFGLAPELAPPGSYLTANVVWFPRVNAIFATDATLSSLTNDQRAILEQAASETFAFATESVPASDTVDGFCSGGA